MKKILLAGTALLLSGSLFAQTSTTMSGSDARIGIKAGVNLSRIHYSGFDLAKDINERAKDNVGFHVTAFGDFGVGNNFFIQPGISLQNKGEKYSETSGSSSYDVSRNIMAIEVPVNAVFRIPTGAAGAVQLSAGPYVGFNIAGKQKISGNIGSTAGETERDLEFGNRDNDDFASTDFGANFGLGYRMNNGFMLGANYGLGLTNLIPKDNRSGDSKATNRVLGFSIGYSF